MPVEVAVEDLAEGSDPKIGGKFKLAATCATVAALKKCWDPDAVYLPVLCPKFLKLSLQILSRSAVC